MTPEAAPDLIRMLEESRQELIGAASKFTDGDAAVAPDAGGWSVLHCLEHVTLSEHRFQGWLAAAPRQEMQADSRATELAQRLADRSKHVQAPEPAQPKGRFSSVAEALAAFDAARARSIEIARRRADDLPFLAIEHPRLGPVNGVGLLVIIVSHARRHAEQIREMQR